MKLSHTAILGILIISMQAFGLTCVQSQEPQKELVLSSKDRILIFAPHPDDEIIGCAGILQKAIARKIPLRIVFLTYGDNNQWAFLKYRKHLVLVPQAVRNMGLLRRREAEDAAQSLGIDPSNLIFLGYPDFKTLVIWYRHWGSAPAGRSMLTNAKAVPYRNAYRPGAAYKGEEILADIKSMIQSFKPTKIFVSHPADHNPDHQSFYLFTKVALWDLSPSLKPEVFPYLIHCKQWPRPHGFHPEIPLSVPDVLEDDIQWYRETLSPEEIDKKTAAIKTNVSQYRSSASYLLSFVRSNELFGDFPVCALHTDGAQVRPLSLNIKPSLLDEPDSLTSEDRAAFVGFEERKLKLDGDDLVCIFKLSRPMGKTVGASVSIFSYRPDVSFSKMPKIYVRLGVFGYSVFDQNKRLPKEAVTVERDVNDIKVRVPLKVLGNPTKVFTNARTYLGSVSLDSVAWRTLEIVRD